MAGPDEIAKLGKKLVEAPKEVIDEAIGLVGDGLNGVVSELTAVVSTTFEGVQSAVKEGMEGVKGVVERPVNDISSRVTTLGSKLRS